MPNISVLFLLEAQAPLVAWLTWIYCTNTTKSSRHTSQRVSNEENWVWCHASHQVWRNFFQTKIVIFFWTCGALYFIHHIWHIWNHVLLEEHILAFQSKNWQVTGPNHQRYIWWMKSKDSLSCITWDNEAMKRWSKGVTPPGAWRVGHICTVISSGMGRILGTSFVGLYIEPFIHPLISNECGTLSHILFANIWSQSIIQMSKWPNLNSKMHRNLVITQIYVIISMYCWFYMILKCGGWLQRGQNYYRSDRQAFKREITQPPAIT